jgi:hypothetical protein
MIDSTGKLKFQNGVEIIGQRTSRSAFNIFTLLLS